MQPLNTELYQRLLVQEQKLNANAIMCIKIWLKKKKAFFGEVKRGAVGLEGSHYVPIFPRSVFGPFCLILS